MDIIFIQDLQIETIIGIYDWERKLKQTVSLDIEMAADIQEAAKQDNITYTLDYKAVADRLTAFIQASQFQLIETMAEQSATILLQEFHVSWLRLRVSKPGAVTNAQQVGVVIERKAIERYKS